jgi:hypothetical protein
MSCLSFESLMTPVTGLDAASVSCPMPHLLKLQPVNFRRQCCSVDWDGKFFESVKVKEGTVEHETPTREDMFLTEPASMPSLAGREKCTIASSGGLS